MKVNINEQSINIVVNKDFINEKIIPVINEVTFIDNKEISTPNNTEFFTQILLRYVVTKLFKDYKEQLEVNKPYIIKLYTPDTVYQISATYVSSDLGILNGLTYGEILLGDIKEN